MDHHPFRLIGVAEIAARWPEISGPLEAAEVLNPKVLPGQLYTDLMAGRFYLIEHDAEDATGWLAFEMFDNDGSTVCFASYVGGRVAGRALLKTMRKLMREFEALAKSSGVEEIWIGGRDWSRVFPDYETFDDVPNRRRKVL